MNSRWRPPIGWRARRHPACACPYTARVYAPMLELLSYLRANGFKTYIVSGGTVEFMRAFAETVYGVPPEQVIGSTFATQFRIGPDGKPELVREPRIDFIDDGPGKPVAINKFIGRRPVFAFGNSDGDQQMLEWTTAGSGPRFAGLVHHTDAAREYAYDRTSKIGRLDKALDEAEREGLDGGRHGPRLAQGVSGGRREASEQRRSAMTSSHSPHTTTGPLFTGPLLPGLAQELVGVPAARHSSDRDRHPRLRLAGGHARQSGPLVRNLCGRRRNPGDRLGDHGHTPMPRWWLAIVGIAGLAAAFMAFTRPGLTIAVLLMVIAVWAIVFGIMEIIGAIQLRKEIDNEWFLILSGTRCGHLWRHPAVPARPRHARAHLHVRHLRGHRGSVADRFLHPPQRTHTRRGLNGRREGLNSDGATVARPIPTQDRGRQSVSPRRS